MAIVDVGVLTGYEVDEQSIVTVKLLQIQSLFMW